jgi:hypothetical protein
MSAMPSSDEAIRFMTQAVLYQQIDLSGPWEGWKIRGQYLVSPDRERIMMRELIGLLIHYRAKFGHKRSKSKNDLASNVIPFAVAAENQLRTRNAKRAAGMARSGAAARGPAASHSRQGEQIGLGVQGGVQRGA